MLQPFDIPPQVVGYFTIGLIPGYRQHNIDIVLDHINDKIHGKNRCFVVRLLTSPTHIQRANL